MFDEENHLPQTAFTTVNLNTSRVLLASKRRWSLLPWSKLGRLRVGTMADYCWPLHEILGLASQPGLWDSAMVRNRAGQEKK